MITITRIIKALGQLGEATAKARVNSVLLGMGREKVEEFGYSYDALHLGPSAWPWRKTTQDSAEEKETRAHLSELKTFGDRKLNDQGIARNGIEQAVCQALPRINPDRNAA